jgi:flotillin
MENVLIIGGIIVAALVILGMLFSMCYRKCPPNKAMVITGMTGTTTVIGRARIVIPFIQRVDYMSLENIQVDFTSRDEIPTKDAINVMVDAVANMAISQEPEVLKIASSKFLGYSIKDIQEIVTPVLEGNIREIISQTTLKELIQGDKKAFAEKVVENVSPNLRDMGLTLTTFNIQNFKDKNGVIENLGIENTVQISKDAATAKAAAESEIAIAQAKAAKLANDAQVESDLEIAKARARAKQESEAAKIDADTSIALKQNELNVKRAELQQEVDTKQAIAEAAKGIQAEEQRKLLEIKTADANLARQEKAIELQAREVEIREKQLDAEIKKKAEAEKFAVQQEADAKLYETQRQSEAQLFERQRKAEAEKFEAEQQAEAQKARAAADKFSKEQAAEAVKVQGLADAEAIRAKGLAESEAIKAKALAEAEGLREKANAMKEYGDAAKQQMQLDTLKVYFEQLPAIAKAIGEGYTNVDSIYMYGGESSKLAGDMLVVPLEIK